MEEDKLKRRVYWTGNYWKSQIKASCFHNVKYRKQSNFRQRWEIQNTAILKDKTCKKGYLECKIKQRSAQQNENFNFSLKLKCINWRSLAKSSLIYTKQEIAQSLNYKKSQARLNSNLGFFRCIIEQ